MRKSAVHLSLTFLLLISFLSFIVNADNYAGNYTKEALGGLVFSTSLDLLDFMMIFLPFFVILILLVVVFVLVTGGL